MVANGDLGREKTKRLEGFLGDDFHLVLFIALFLDRWHCKDSCIPLPAFHSLDGSLSLCLKGDNFLGYIHFFTALMEEHRTHLAYTVAGNTFPAQSITLHTYHF